MIISTFFPSIRFNQFILSPISTSTSHSTSNNSVHSIPIRSPSTSHSTCNLHLQFPQHISQPTIQQLTFRFRIRTSSSLPPVTSTTSVTRSSLSTWSSSTCTTSLIRDEDGAEAAAEPPLVEAMADHMAEL